MRPTAAGDLTRLADVRRVRANLARTRAQMLRRFLDAKECRWRQLLAYFGETSSARCGRCDVCDDDAATDERAGETAGLGRSDRTGPAGPGRQAIDPTGAPFAVGARVDHDAFGRGEVVDASEHDLTVLFDEGGYRVIDARLAAEGLLRASPG